MAACSNGIGDGRSRGTGLSMSGCSPDQVVHRQRGAAY